MSEAALIERLRNLPHAAWLAAYAEAIESCKGWTNDNNKSWFLLGLNCSFQRMLNAALDVVIAETEPAPEDAGPTTAG